MNFKKRIIIPGALCFTLAVGATGVYAGTLIERYKTVRGNIATVEQENIHKGRIAITVNGQSIKADTWYANNVTYAPIREVADLLGASVQYNATTQSADIVTESELLNLLGLTIKQTYYGTHRDGRDVFEFKILTFNPVTNQFTGEALRYGSERATIEGTISEKTLNFKEIKRISGKHMSYALSTYELEYTGTGYSGILYSYDRNDHDTIEFSLK